MNKTSFTKTLLFFLLVGIEHINASSNNLRKRKATATTTSFIDTVSSIFMIEDWSCCDGTNEPTPVPTVTFDVPTSSSSPSYIRSAIPTAIPTASPTTSPTYIEKKLTASDGANGDWFGWSCSMSNELIVIGAPFAGYKEGAAYLYHLNGNQIKKLRAGDDGENNDYFGSSVSLDEKVIVGTYSNYVQVFSLEGDYERSITCDDCSIFGESVATYSDKIVISRKQNSIWSLLIYTTEGELLKTIDNGDEEIKGVAISDKVIVFTTGQNTLVYSNSVPDFEEIVEIPQGGREVATSGERIIIGDMTANNFDGAVWLYETDGAFIRTLEHDSEKFGRSLDITDDKIIVGVEDDDEGGINAGSVFIYSSVTGDFQEKVLAQNSEAYDYFGSSVCASDSYYVVGAYGDDVVGAAHLFPLSD